MSIRFTVLASGSSGNASLLEVDGFGLLLDAGLGPRQLGSRMQAVGASWRHVHALLLTHTHGDHWHERTFTHLWRQRAPVYCHADHLAELQQYSRSFGKLQEIGLVRHYEPHVDMRLAPGVRCLPLPLRHDGAGTFGFRFECSPEVDGVLFALGYVADLGSWNHGLVAQLADVDVLALEFNHDVELEQASDRSPQLIARVLGDHGHLSNAQATELLRAILGASVPGRMQHVIQLHLSRECNRPDLAAQAVRAVLEGVAGQIQLHTACQDTPGPSIRIGVAGSEVRTAQVPRHLSPVPALTQRWLPGVEAET
ncbi:MAG TPA: MBL fold metallo-hydrolase [Gemmataceae bacterium]|nr:MBL fold metallo-hydrolase [Gemmataceae bacterium]